MSETLQQPCQPLPPETQAEAARWGHPAEALEALRRAMAVDPARVRGWLTTDPVFGSLQGNAEYEALAKG